MTDSGPYRIEVDPAAGRSLHRLPEKIATAIVQFITGALADNPTRLSTPLRGELSAYRSARRGDYRVLIQVDERTRTVLVTHVDHRSDIYRARG